MKKLFAVALGHPHRHRRLRRHRRPRHQRPGRRPVRAVARLGRRGRRRRHLRLRRDVAAGSPPSAAGRPSTSSASGSGPASGWPTWSASMAVTLLTFVAEIGGVALSLELATSVNYLLLGARWSPSPVWLVLWRVQVLDDGERLRAARPGAVVFAVALWQLDPTGARCAAGTPPRPSRPTRRGRRTGYYAVALFGAAMTPYEVFFFSSGGVEEGWTREGPRAPCGPTCSSGSRSAACSRSRSPAAPPWCCCPLGIRSTRLGQVGAAGRRRAGQARAGRRADPRVRRGDLRRRLRDRPVGRLQHRPVLRLAVGQVRPADARPRRFHTVVLLLDACSAVGGAADDGRPDHGHRVLGGVLRASRCR